LLKKTPEEKWKGAILAYRKNCQKILAISKSIRYVGVINEYGRTLTGIIQTGIRPLLKQEDAKNEFFIISNLITLRNSQSKILGGLTQATFWHKNAIVVCIPHNKVIYYTSINPGTKSIGEIVKKIRELV
jgi:hypothetical protein